MRISSQPNSPMIAIALLMVSVLSLSLSGCSSASSRAAAIGDARLKADALAMLAKWEATSPSVHSIPETFWPDTIRSLHPVDVYPHGFGVLVVTSKSSRYHCGVYIVTDNVQDEETNPSSGSGQSYSTIATGLHYAEVKIRTPAFRATDDHE